MKTILKSALCCLFMGVLTNGYSAILTVDNNPSNNAMYSSFSAARDAANPGDTILIHSSGVNYGTINVNKSLTVIGTGHSGSANVVGSYLRITASDVNVEGIYFSGLSGNGLSISTSYNRIAGSNIQIKNCITRHSFQIENGIENIVFLGCVIGYATSSGIRTGYSASSQFTNAQNVTYLNNIIMAYTLDAHNNTWLYQNNIIVKPTTGNLFNGSNQTFVNNIFYIMDTTAWNPENCGNCAFQQNLTNSPDGVISDLPNSTLNNTEPTWDLNEEATYFFDLESNYHMLSGAPATGAIDGGEVGIYGSDFNFEMHGVPYSFPRVTSTSILNPVVSSGGELQIEFEAEGDTN